MLIPFVGINRRVQLAGFAMRLTIFSGALFYAVSFPSAPEAPQVLLEHTKSLECGSNHANSIARDRSLQDLQYD